MAGSVMAPCAAAQPIIDNGGAGDDLILQQAAEQVNELCDRMNHWVFTQTKRALEKGKLPAIVGGDHSVPFGAIKAAAEKHRGLGVLHVDAHAGPEAGRRSVGGGTERALPDAATGSLRADEGAVRTGEPERERDEGIGDDERHRPSIAHPGAQRLGGDGLRGCGLCGDGLGSHRRGSHGLRR